MLSLQDVSHVYGNGTRALDHVTLSIPRAMYGLLGPNGAGKSTLMRAIATLQVVVPFLVPFLPRLPTTLRLTSLTGVAITSSMVASSER